MGLSGRSERVDQGPLHPLKADIRRRYLDVSLGPCVDGFGLARVFFTSAALVGAAMCSAFQRGSRDRWP